MGRGRAKAKQTKVARELKYSTAQLDPERLRAELASGSPLPSRPLDDDPVDEELIAKYLDDDEDSDDEDDADR